MEITNFRKEFKNTKQAAYEWQDRAAQVIKAWSPPASYHSMIFKHFRNSRSKAEASFRYIEDRGDIKTKWTYFAWLMTHDANGDKSV